MKIKTKSGRTFAHWQIRAGKRKMIAVKSGGETRHEQKFT